MAQPSTNRYPVAWIREAKYCDLTGENRATLRNRRNSGKWIQGIHWRTGPDRRVWINVWKAQEWVEQTRLEVAA